MSEAPTSPDVVELTRRSFEAGSRRDVDAALSFYAGDSVWDMSPLGLGTYEGLPAIRAFFEDWLGAYEAYAMDVEQLLDLGNGVVFFAVRQHGRPAGTSGDVELRYAGFAVWTDGK